MGSTTGSIIINVKGKDVTVGVNAPANPKDNELWLDTNDGQNILKYYSSKDKKWHNVNDMSGEFGKIYTELKTNYYTKKESDDSVKTIIGETTITKSDGKVVNMKDAINSVIDTSNSHTTQIGEIETKFSDYSTIEDVNSKITKVQQTSEDYTIEAIKNLNIGAANLINGSTIYTEDNKLSITATTDDFVKTLDNIYVDLEKDKTYTFNCKTDGIYGVSSIYPELIITTGNSSKLIKLSMLNTGYTYSQTNMNKFAANGYSGDWVCEKIGQQKIGNIVRFKLYNSTTKSYNYILAKITAINGNKVTATSLGCLMTEYNMPMLISGYSYNQTGVDKYSAYGYSGDWIVTDVSTVAVGSVARIRVKNSTTGRYNYVIAKITAIDTTNKKVTAKSFTYVEASYGGIPYTKGDNITLKCNCTGGNGKLMYKFVAHSLGSGNWWNLTNPQESNECSFNITGTAAYDFVCVVTDELNMRGDSQYVRIFSGIDDDGSGYQSTSIKTYLDTVEVYFLKDRAYTTLFRPSSLPYTFNCTETGRYYLRVDVNKKDSTHSFWNFKMERGNKATDWSINPVEEHATLKVSSDKINAVVSSLDSEGSITLTDKMAKVVADTISFNGTVKVNGDMLVDGAVTVDKIASNAITADKLAISTEGFVKDPMFMNWKDNAVPDGFVDWNSSFANGKVRKIVENNANLIEMIASATELTGLKSNGGSTSTTSLFSYKLSLDGLKYICVEIKFRLTNGVNPSGAGLLLDVYGYNASNTLVTKRIICKLSDLGTSLTNNVWYTYRKIIKLDDTMSACKLASLSAYLLCNYSELGTLTAKTIQFASLNVYRATEQDYLTQSWTSGTYINGNALLTGSVTADSIATDAIKSKNYNDGSMGSEKLGAYFNLADGTMKTPYLSWDKRGQLKCSSANISGKVTASSGKIGNWNIQMSVTNGIGSSGMLYSAINHTDSQGYGEQYLVHLAPINIYNTLNDTWVLAAYHYDMPDKKAAIANWFLTYGGEFYTIGRHRCMGSTYPQIFGNGAVLQLSQTSDASTGVVIENTTFRPSGNATMTLGTDKHRWNNLYISASAIVTSDKNKKNSIEDLDDDITKELIMGLIPKSYKYDDGTSGRTHYGLIAQDVEELLERLGIDTKDFAGFIKSPNVKEYETNKLDDDGNVILDEGGNPQKEFVREVIEGEYDYALRYEEFISPLIKVVQEHEKEIEELKNKNIELETKYNDLLSRIEKLENAEGSN